ncbi:hypothetical protein Tco_0118829 [Tanacetum coccineum]
MSSITKPKHPCGVFTLTQTYPVDVKPEPDAHLGSGRGGGWRGAVMVVWVAVMRWRGWSRGGGGDDDDDKMMMVVATRRDEAAEGGGMACEKSTEKLFRRRRRGGGRNPAAATGARRNI